MAHFVANRCDTPYSASAKKTRNSDNSNTHYALLGLNAAREVGVPVKPEVWALARRHWQQYPHSPKKRRPSPFRPFSSLVPSSFLCVAVAASQLRTE
jgi:hypothetical protein